MTNALANGHAPALPLPFDPASASHADEELIQAAGNAVASVWRKVSLGGVLITLAALLLAALATAEGIVSWHGQFSFIYAIKHEYLPAALEALGPDCGAVIFALLGVALALRGRRAVTERALVCACSGLSVVMNLAAADLGSPRAIGAYVLPPCLFAITSDRLIATIRLTAVGREEGRSAWLALARFPLWILRFAVAPAGTARGLRQAILTATPLPETAVSAMGSVARLSRQHDPTRDVAGQLPTKTPAALPASPRKARSGEPTKAARLIDAAAARHDLAVIDMAAVSSVATGLAAEIDLHPATARRVLIGHVRKLQGVRS